MIRHLIILIFFLGTLCANVTLKAPASFIVGEPVFFTIEAIGENIVFPKIEKIENYEVEAAGQSSSFSNINGQISAKVQKRFRFFPISDVVIPAFKLSIANKDIFTKEHKLLKQKISKTKSEHLDLNISLTKTDLYVGEQTILTMTFKYKKGLQIMDTSMMKPEFRDFWYKRLDAKEPYEEGMFIIQDLHYLLFPQKSGKLKIDPLRVDASLLDVNSSAFAFFQKTSKTVKIYSNSLDLNVKPLPSGISLIGDFNINAIADKTKINLGESISYKIEITGFGNIDDVQDVKLDIPNVTIYDNKPTTTVTLKDNKHYGTYKKSFSILPTENIVIPSVSISYFDKKQNRVVSKSTKAINIEVIGSAKTNSKLLKADEKEETKVITKEPSIYDKLVYYVLGVVTALLIFGLYNYVIKTRELKKETPLEKRIKKASNKKDLIKEILPFISKDENLDSLIFKLENSDEANFKTIKKEILESLKEIK